MKTGAKVYLLVFWYYHKKKRENNLLDGWWQIKSRSKFVLITLISQQKSLVCYLFMEIFNIFEAKLNIIRELGWKLKDFSLIQINLTRGV